MNVRPTIRFVNVDGSDRISPFVNAVGMSLDRRDAGNPAAMYADFVGIGLGDCDLLVYTFSIDWNGTTRIIPGNPLSLLPNFLDGEVLNNIREKKAVLLLDDSTEACRFSDQFGTAFIKMMANLGIPLKSLYLVSQNARFLDDLTKWLTAQNLPSIRSYYYSYFLAAIAQYARVEVPNVDAWHAHVSTGWRRLFGPEPVSKKFICMNNMPKPHRLGVLINLLDTTLIKDGFVSFASGEVIKTVFVEPRDLLYSVSRVMDVHGCRGSTIRSYIAQIHNGPGFVIDREIPGISRSMNITNDLNTKFFGDSLFTIHCETEFTDGVCRRITEKTFKPFFNFHPFVMFGDPGTLALARELGFRTFSPFIDETYDTIPDPHKRFDMAWSEVVRLASMDKTQLRDSMRSLWPTLRYNAQYALDGLRNFLLFKHAYPLFTDLLDDQLINTVL